uniref:Phosphatase and actin regulator n=1 Tax=Rousettus aegyptiacus TaxID=9407 RepID=A0A7J8DJU5_ROUAE|nr:phosphatase and actin regulator 3 [Rousettus aegyptiacus]
MAASEDRSGCLVSRGRSQSDPSVLTESSAAASAEARENPDEMDPAPPARSEYLVSGTRTPPVRRNSKLATLGRIFKPWKWRKKKNEKLKQTTSALEKKMASRQGREELIKKGLLEMMEQDSESKVCNPDGGPRATRSDPSTPEQEALTLEEARPGSPLATGTDQDPPERPLSSDAHPDDAAKMPSAPRGEDADAPGSLLPAADKSPQALAGSDAPDGPPGTLERAAGQLPSPPLLPTPLPKAVPKATKNVTGQAAAGKSPDPPLRGQLATPTGSPHLTTVRLSRTSSVERAWTFDGAAAKESEENKENLRVSSDPDGDLLLCQDEEALNDSVISGTLPRKCKKELLAVKLRNRPSKQELEERNIFPRRTDAERQEIRLQIEMKLSKRLSQRPAVEELERRNILKQRNDQTEQEERREIKQRLTRKLNQRPTVDELRDRKILIRFSDYVEVAKAQDYDRRADKPWTRLSAADKAAIRKELNEYKSNEMEVHASSKHLTRFHRP